MAKFLFHISVGPENATRAALGFLVAKTAREAGHEVTMFLAGDGAELIRDSVIDTVVGLGTGKLREHFDRLVEHGVKIYISGMSAKSRGIGEVELKGKPAEFAMPEVLVRLSLECDKLFTY
jgi:predicted peroxiredoxin